MTKVFLDASVIIAAILSSGGGSAKILSLASKGKILAIVSQTVVLEVLEHKEKIGKTEAEINDFVLRSKIVVREEISYEEAGKYFESVEKDDAHLVAGARLTKCNYLISLDKKHVLSLNDKFSPLKIVDPKEFLSKRN